MKKIGIYNPYLESKGGGEKVCLSLASVLSENNNNQVILITHAKVNLKSLANYFNIDLSRVRVEHINFEKIIVKAILKLPIPAGFKFFLIDLYTVQELRHFKLDIFINNYYQNNMPNVGKKGIYMCMFPQKLHENPQDIGYLKSVYRYLLIKLRRITMHPLSKHGVLTYEKIIANSKYTQRYIKKYWGCDSEVLYPICEDMRDPSIQKCNIILNVGRFFGFDDGSHHKRQDFLLECFSEMKEMHKSGWELHFAGSIANDRRARKFVKQLQKDARGLPIYFHLDTSFEQLKKLYNQSSIYWHATGYGSNPDENPEKQEHFGITTVEAMSTGAVPIVINTAGQKESVDKKSGYLWNNKNELITFTERVSNNHRNFKSLSSQSIKASKIFSKETFRNNVKHYFNK